MLLSSIDVDGFLVRLETMLKAGLTLRDALKLMGKIKGAAKLAEDSLWSLEEEGKTFSDGIKKYLSPAEYALLRGGEKSNNLIFAISKVLYLRSAQKKIKSVFIGAMIYPASVLVLVLGALYYVANKVVPELESAGIKTEAVLRAYAYVLQPKILLPLVVLAIAVFVGMIIFTTKFLGPYRRHTDRFFPFRIYRAWMGVIFFYLVSSLTKSGYTLADALEEIASSNSYFQWVVGDYLAYYRVSRNLGEAMLKSGFAIPDEESAELLEILSSFGKFEDRLITIAEDMVEGYKKKAEAISKLVSMSTLMFAGILVVIFFVGMYATIMSASDAMMTNP